MRYPTEDKHVNDRYMNQPACHGHAYCPTTYEHVANVITHGVMIVPAFYAWQNLLNASTDNLQYANALLYGFATLFLFSSSTLYHTVSFFTQKRKLKYYLHMLDRAAIYFFIASSYSPWLTLKHIGSCGAHMRWVVWLLAITGIVYQYIFHEKYKLLETILYVFTGVFPSVSVFSMEEWSGIPFLAVGGSVYICGVVFFKSDGRIPCAHAIWHLHVALGAAIHYYAVSAYLMCPSLTDLDKNQPLAVKVDYFIK